MSIKTAKLKIIHQLRLGDKDLNQLQALVKDKDFNEALLQLQLDGKVTQLAACWVGGKAPHGGQPVRFHYKKPLRKLVKRG